MRGYAVSWMAVLISPQTRTVPKVYFRHAALWDILATRQPRQPAQKLVPETTCQLLTRAMRSRTLPETSRPRNEELVMPPSPRAYKVGYARVSASDQKLDAQCAALQQAGCHKVFADHVSGIKADRPGWEQLMAYVRPGDTVIVMELSRMSRSLMQLLAVVQTFEHQGMELVSLREHLDTSTATGRGFLAMMGGIAQMERELKAERTAAGRAAAKARGRTGGRPRTDPDKLEQARLLYLNSDRTAAQVCHTVGIGRRTLLSYLAQVKNHQAANASG
jgi:DNA invertase Pin-like site-specific DNA recombinase